MSLREVWCLAVGAHDRDIRSRAFWMAAFGKEPSSEDLIRMHPMRRMERSVVDKPPEVKAAESKAGWRLVNQFFSQKRA